MDLNEQCKALIAASTKSKKYTAELLSAAKDVGDALESVVPHGVPLPRHYRVVTYGNGNKGYATFLAAECACESGGDDWDCPHTNGLVNCDTSGYLFGQFDLPDLARTSRAVALRIATDVETGWIGELANFIALRAGKSESAAVVLTRASTALASP